MATAERTYISYIERGFNHDGFWIGGQITERTEKYDDADPSKPAWGATQRTVGVTEAEAIAAAPDGPLIAQVQNLTDQLAAMTTECDVQKTARKTSEAQVASLTEQLAAAQARIAELEQSIPIINNVPQQVTNYQARAALISAGLFNAVDDAVKAQGSASQAYQAWEYANVYLRTSPFIIEMGATLGLTTEQIDALFVTASQIS